MNQFSCFQPSLLNCMGCVVTCVTWVRGLPGSIFYVGCVGYVGPDIFYVGQNFRWAIIFTWFPWVKYIFAWVRNFLRKSLRGSEIFAWVNFYLFDEIILLYYN